MALWDDVVKLFSGNQNKSQSNTKSKSSSGDRRGGGGSFEKRPSTYTPATLAPSFNTDNGGGGGEVASPWSSLDSQPETLSGPDPWENFRTTTQNKPEEPKFTQDVKDMTPEERAKVGSATNTPGLGDDPWGWLVQQQTTSNNANNVWGEALMASSGDKEAQQRFDDTATTFAAPINEQAVQDEKKTDFDNSLGHAGVRGVRELTPEEWGGLSQEQQQGVIANYALYQASLADRSITDEVGDQSYEDNAALLFGDDRGSKRYAPNTVAVLQELGITNDQLDLDQLLDGRAFLTYNELMGQGNPDLSPGRAGVFQSLSDASAYDTESVQASLAAGRSLLDAVRNSAATAATSQYGQLAGAASQITDPNDLADLDTLFGNLASREVIERAKTDPSINSQLTAGIDEANTRFGAEAVAQYFRDAAPRVTDTTNFLAPDEFISTWIGE